MYDLYEVSSGYVSTLMVVDSPTLNSVFGITISQASGIISIATSPLKSLMMLLKATPAASDLAPEAFEGIPASRIKITIEAI